MHARGRRSQRLPNRLHPSDGCCCCKEHRKKVRLIRPRQSEAEQGDRSNYGELSYLEVQSRPPLCREHTLALSQTNRGERGATCVRISCRRRAASTLSSRSIFRRQSQARAKS